MATRLYDCFLRDRLDSLSTVVGIEPVVAFTPPEARDAMIGLTPAGFALIPQRGGDLGARLDRVLTDLLAAGHPAAIAMDSDSPTLPMSYVDEAAKVLMRREAEVVIGPCDDGGYYLIGVRRPRPELFRAIPWSTDRVLALTLERSRRYGLRAHLLPSWFDVDTEDDLIRLRNALVGDSTGPRRTAALVREIAGSLVSPRGEEAIEAPGPRQES